MSRAKSAWHIGMVLMGGACVYIKKIMDAKCTRIVVASIIRSGFGLEDMRYFTLMGMEISV